MHQIAVSSRRAKPFVQSLYVNIMVLRRLGPSNPGNRIPQAKLIPQMTDAMSRLSLSDRLRCPSISWSRLEALPPEIFRLILSHLAFFDKKALSSTSWRVYDLAGPIEPPDRFAWRLHLCSAFNRCSDNFFDITIFNPDDVTRELTRIAQQTIGNPKRGHYVLDTNKTRFRDLNCLYFPSGYHVQYGNYSLVCRTLGHFVAIQFRAYVARLLRETKAGEDSAFKRGHIDPRIDFTKEHKANLTMEAQKWASIRNHWMQRCSAPKSDVRCDGDVLFDSAVDATEGLVRRMAVKVSESPSCLDHQWRQPAGAPCTKLPAPRELNLPMVVAEYNSGTISKYDRIVDRDEHSGDENGTHPTFTRTRIQDSHMMTANDYYEADDEDFDEDTMSSSDEHDG